MSEGDLQRIASPGDWELRQVALGRSAELPSLEVELRMAEADATESLLVVPVLEFPPGVRAAIDEGVELIVAGADN